MGITGITPISVYHGNRSSVTAITAAATQSNRHLNTPAGRIRWDIGESIPVTHGTCVTATACNALP